MEPILNLEQQQLRDSAERLCQDFAGSKRLRALKARGVGTDNDAWTQIKKAQWPQLLVPESHGGLGMGVLELSLAMQAGGRYLLLAPVVAVCAGMDALAHALGPSQFQAHLAISEQVYYVSIDERDHYTAGIRWPLAQRVPTGYVLNGQVPISGAAEAGTVFLTPSRTIEGHPILVALPSETLGVRIRVRFSTDGSRSDVLMLDDVQLSPDAVLAEGDLAVALHARTADILRIGTSAELIGVAARALDMALDHLRTRRQFGKPLASFQALQHQCVNCFLDIELNLSLLYRTSLAWDRGQAHPAMVSALKSRASRAALSTSRVAIQLHGAMGYTETHDIGLYYKRALALAALYGNENHHASLFSALTLG